ncbi:MULTISPECIES: NAD(P)-dependent oxidoreductase [unclassified Legionella]|uniref:NAD-dependent epimerase/dehydratase family protein n=1 Tax=unclassified Legionella TaxID=2622702 RepID=UPI0010556838|nr:MULTISPECIES: NAD-dependent epimerase/dehydratase family protein [unclassified Legionella]MDI9817777.1 NAD-dependent epimerase/dehydratase family protein [Legionella sp. PL877]
MTILVLGGTGFVGRAVVNSLVSKHRCFEVLTRHPEKLTTDKIPFIVGDLLDWENLDLSPYSTVINCAGEIQDETLMRTLHVDATLGLLSKFKSLAGRHWLQLSSVGVYGKRQNGRVSETTGFAPVGEYEVTKAEGELLVKEFCLANNIHYTIIRPSIVFGMGMPNQSLAQLISIIKRNLFFYVGRKVTDISMNYVHVNDVADLVVRCIDNEVAYNQDFIISDQVSLPEFVEVIRGSLGKNARSVRTLPEKPLRLIAKAMKIIPSFPITEPRIDALTSRTVYSTDKAKELLGFIPSVGLKNGLKEYSGQFK